MGDYSNNPDIYTGADYTLEPRYSFKGDSNSPYMTGTSVPAGRFSAPTDPRTANQIQAVSQKISTGLRNIEVSGVNISGGGPMDLIDNIPKQHFKEINRLKKLAGVELTFHGPLVEATGVAGGRWDPQQRVQAEREMTSAIQRAHDLDPDGKIIVTFHSSNGLPEPITKVKGSDGREIVEKVAVIDEHTGGLGYIPKGGVNYFAGKSESDPRDEIKVYNEKEWSTLLNNIGIGTEHANDAIAKTENLLRVTSSDKSEDVARQATAGYALSVNKPEEYQKYLNELGPEREIVQRVVNNLSVGAVNAQNSYQILQEAYNKAMSVAKRDNNKEMENKLEGFRKEIAPLTQKYNKDPEKLNEFVEKIGEGVRLLQAHTKDNAPRVYRELSEFAIDKASETFANVAFNGYKEFGKSAPVISIENPPVGMGLSKGEELAKLVEEAQRKFVERAVKEKRLSEDEAKAEAKKLIGVTWDVGHINMLRKYGYDDKDLVKETGKVAKHIKHIHLSDNFGLEHTELPMGMGNVPIKEELAVIEEKLGKEYFKKVKQVIETGGWFRNFNTTPFAETLEAFGSPIYGMKMSPYWNRTRGTGSGYFSGYGRTLPDVHFSVYGAGFSNLPSELGGQMGGRSRMSGTPTE